MVYSETAGIGLDTVRSEHIVDGEVNYVDMVSGTQGEIITYGSFGVPENLGGASGTLLKSQGVGNSLVFGSAPETLPILWGDHTHTGNGTYDNIVKMINETSSAPYFVAQAGAGNNDGTHTSFGEDAILELTAAYPLSWNCNFVISTVSSNVVWFMGTGNGSLAGMGNNGMWLMHNSGSAIKLRTGVTDSSDLSASFTVDGITNHIVAFNSATTSSVTLVVDGVELVTQSTGLPTGKMSWEIMIDQQATSSGSVEEIAINSISFGRS